MGLQIENCNIHGRGNGSIYVEGGLISSISEDQVRASSPETTRIDARGGSVVIGLIDSHCHPFEYGKSKRTLDLRAASNVTSLRVRLSSRVQKTPPGAWVAGRGWDQEAFAERRMPNRLDIDDLSPNNPVVLTRVCGHIALLNTSAISALSLDSRSGPEYERDTTGLLTGIVREGGLDEVYSGMPRESADVSLQDLEAFEFEALRNGLTAAHCIVSPERYREELDALAQWKTQRTGRLRYRIYVPPEAVEYVEEKGLRTLFGDGSARINGVKVYADGSLGARTAALREPYSDDPGNSGLLRYKDEEIFSIVEKCHSLEYQIIIHAIGDRAIDQAVAALSGVSGGGNPLRHRIEHASLLPKDLRAEMRKWGIRAAVQPCFITSDSWAASRLGEERARDLYPLKSMLEVGILVSGSSDSPVEGLSPVIGMWASMVRGGFAPEERLTQNQALSLYTSNAALNGFDDGAIMEEGGVASLTILDSDIEEMHPAMLRKVGVAATVVNGETVYSFEGTG